jgi:hypothetical protein
MWKLCLVVKKKNILFTKKNWKSIFMWKLFIKGKIGITKKSSQKVVSPLYISID